MTERLFSTRFPQSLRPNRLTTELARCRERGCSVIDLTVANPTAVGLRADPQALVAAFANSSMTGYQPAALGGRETRAVLSRALDGLYPAERLALTCSTSEAYGLLFKLLCSPGDGVLVPRPSYPLFDSLTRLEGVTAIPYDMHYDGSWQLDLVQIEASLTPTVRAVLLVSPNNPTGHYLRRDELERLAAICEDRAALIVDEVFFEYGFTAESHVRAAAVGQGLVFGLGGLSKWAGLPQLKLGWIGVSGTPSVCSAALARLELIADAYLSVAAPVQVALAKLLPIGAALRGRIRERVATNRGMLGRIIAERFPACTLLTAQGGWYAVVQVPAWRSEEELVLAALRDDAVLVHPGYFFDFAHEAYVVLSLITAPEDFMVGVERVLRRASQPPDSHPSLL